MYHIIVNGLALRKLTEYDNSSGELLAFESKESADNYALSMGYENYTLEESPGLSTPPPPPVRKPNIFNK